MAREADALRAQVADVTGSISGMIQVSWGGQWVEGEAGEAISGMVLVSWGVSRCDRAICSNTRVISVGGWIPSH